MTRRDHLLNRRPVAATTGGRSQQSLSSGVSKSYTWRRRRLAWAARSASSITARDRQSRAWSATSSHPRSAPATVPGSASNNEGPVHSLRQDLVRAHHESLPGARIIIARPPSVRYREAEHAPLLQPAEFISQSSDGRSILGVLQRLEDVCFQFYVPFVTMQSRSWPPVDELRCLLAYNPASDACEFFCNSHNVALVGESSIQSHYVKQGEIQNIEPGIWTIVLPSNAGFSGSGSGLARPVVEFLLLKRTYASTLSRSTAAEEDSSATCPTEPRFSTAAPSDAAPANETVAEFVMGAVQPPKPQAKLLSIPEGEALKLDPGPFYRLQDGETLQITTSPAGSPNTAIERRYASTAESYQVTRLQKIDRNRHSSVFACIHSKLPHATLVAKALNLKSNSISSLATHWSNEMEILKILDHKNIVKIRAWDARFFTVYLEHLPDSLASYPRESFTPKDVQTILVDVASALTYLEEKKISHNDIKPRNIAYSPERGAVVLDFGLATEGRWVLGSAGGTAWYMPPEALEKGARSSRGNVWAFGVTMLYVLGCIGMPEDYGTAWNFLNLQDPNGPDRMAMEEWADEVCAAVDKLDMDDPVQCVVSCMMDQDPRYRLAASEIEPELRKQLQLAAN